MNRKHQDYLEVEIKPNIVLSNTTLEYVGVNGIEINGLTIQLTQEVRQTLANIPTKTSDLINDSNFTNKTYVDTGLSGKQANLTSSQLSAVNSGITDELVAEISLNTNARHTHANKSILDGIGASNLTNDTERSAWNAKQDAINDLSTIRTGAGKGATAVQPSDLNDYAKKTYVDNYHDATKADKSYVDSQDNSLNNKIDAIEDKIPSAATSSNQLADKNFVNSSIASATANFKGTLDVVDDLGLSYGATTAQVATALNSHAFSPNPTLNDYCFVINKDTDNNVIYQRFKYTGTAWLFEYELNNSSFTASQWAAINSGITSGDVSLIATALQPSDLTGYATEAYVQAYHDNTKADKTELPTKTSDLTNDSGFITSSDVPTKTSDLTNDSGFITSSYHDNTKADKTELPTKTSDLTNDSGFITSADIPSIPTKTSDLTNDSGFINSSYHDSSKQDVSTLETDVASKGFTKNVGTITGITMNGASKGNSGVVDLGTVLTEHQSLSAYRTSANQDLIDAGKQDTLVNQTNIKSINGQSILGSGNLVVGGALLYEIILTQPTNVSASGTTIEFDPVDDATSYEVFADGVSIGEKEVN